MRENNEKREEKLSEREIRLGGVGSATRPERPHGKLYRWFDNFWYHYKWHTIAALFIAVVLIVCVVQMSTRESEGDLTIVTAGPYSFMTDEAGLKALNACLSTKLATDIDGDGNKTVRIVSFSVYSAAEIEEMKNRVDKDGKPAGIVVDAYNNTQQKGQYNNYIKTGDASVYFLAPWMFEELATQSQVLTDLTPVLGESPKGAVYTTDKDGNTHCYGIRLGDTELYKNNSAVRVLPEDTVVCLMGPFVFGNSSNEDIYAAAVAYFKELTK